MPHGMIMVFHRYPLNDNGVSKSEIFVALVSIKSHYIHTYIHTYIHIYIYILRFKLHDKFRSFNGFLVTVFK